MGLSRRSFLGSALGLGGMLPRPSPGAATRPFSHGIASGDPLADRVILWTRVQGPPEITVGWEMGLDPDLRTLIRRGSMRSAQSRDWTVKVDVSGLSAGTTYYYRFEALGVRSPIGRTRTLPVGPTESARLAFTSCANMPSGFFNVYARIAERDDLDAVLHLGDYLYEFGAGAYGDGSRFGRAAVPAHELLSLGDYRARHAQYKTDPDLQRAHRQHPFIVVWDDHELANNAWKDGASNHQPDEGSWAARRDAAVRAYFEWMPVREDPSSDANRIYRSFAIGDLAHLAMLDTRLVGRDQQPRFDDLEAMSAPNRTLLGEAQASWLESELAASKAAGIVWRVLGQQVLMGQNTPGGHEILNVDQWDGYRASRERLFDFVRSEGIDNLVVLTGDLHSSWALELTSDPWDRRRYDPETGRGALGVEFVTPSVTSPGPFRRFDVPQHRADEVVEQNPHQKWAEVDHHGYTVLTLTRSWAQADWYFVDTIESRRRKAFWAKGFRTRRGSHHLVEMDSPAR